MKLSNITSLAKTAGNTDTLVGEGIAWFIGKQDPDEISFDKYNNGYQITVKTDKENVDKAAEFWEEYVEDKL